MPALTAVLAAELCRCTVPTLRLFSTSLATSYPREKPQRIRVVSPTAKKVAADYFPVRVFSREQQDGTYNPPPPPPVSPLASDELFKPYHLKHPKSAPKKGTELTPREWALRQNPYGTATSLPPIPRVEADEEQKPPQHRSWLPPSAQRLISTDVSHPLSSFASF
jgi:hypothetical protein